MKLKCDPVQISINIKRVNLKCRRMEIRQKVRKQKNTFKSNLVFCEISKSVLLVDFS